jgi:hypothetical protein
MGLAMILDTLLEQVIFALLGGAAAELLHWYLLARKPEGLVGYKAHPIYWVTTLIMVAFGGIMPFLYIQGSASALLCFHLGAATPVIVQKLLAAPPALVARQGPNGTSLRNFFTW